jgi:hypothetical protein
MTRKPRDSTKFILLALICFFICPSASAQTD